MGRDQETLHPILAYDSQWGCIVAELFDFSNLAKTVGE